MLKISYRPQDSGHTEKSAKSLKYVKNTDANTGFEIDVAETKGVFR
jgi:hypothetical protein